MEVRIDSELTMDGSEGCGGFPTWDCHYHKWVFLPQKGKDVDGGHLSSRDKATTSSGLTQKGPFAHREWKQMPSTMMSPVKQASRKENGFPLPKRRFVGLQSPYMPIPAVPTALMQMPLLLLPVPSSYQERSEVVLPPMPKPIPASPRVFPLRRAHMEKAYSPNL